MSMIHPTAILDSSVRVADGATVGPYCFLGPGVVIGAGTTLHNHVTIQCDTTIGEENELFPFTVIGSDPQDRKYAGEHCTCIIGDRNVIREHVTIHRGTANGGGVTRIGNDNLIMVAAHIAHDAILADYVVIANQVMVAGHVHIDEGASIGGGAGLHHFATVGRCSFVGGLTRITKDVPPFMIVEGNPAEVRAINSIAMQRRGYSPADIEAVKDTFKRIFRDNGAPVAEKIIDIRQDYAGVEAVVQICDALDATADGIHGRALETARHDDKREVLVK